MCALPQADIYRLPPPPLPHLPTPTPSNTPPSTHWLYDLQDIHDELVHSFQNRHIYPLERKDNFHAQIELPPPPMINWCILSKTVRFIPSKEKIISTHRLSCPAHPPPPRAPSCSNPCPHALKNSALPSPVIRLTGYT